MREQRKLNKIQACIYISEAKESLDSFLALMICDDLRKTLHFPDSIFSFYGTYSEVLLKLFRMEPDIKKYSRKFPFSELGLHELQIYGAWGQTSPPFLHKFITHFSFLSDFKEDSSFLTRLER